MKKWKNSPMDPCHGVPSVPTNLSEETQQLLDQVDACPELRNIALLHFIAYEEQRQSRTSNMTLPWNKTMRRLMVIIQKLQVKNLPHEFGLRQGNEWMDLICHLFFLGRFLADASAQESLRNMLVLLTQPTDVSSSRRLPTFRETFDN